MGSKELTREEILNCIESELKSLDYVNGMWQCGSAAFGRVDEWSDIDIVVDVEDDKVMEVFKVTDKVLESLSPIERSFECPQPMSPGAYQKAYKLRDVSKFLLIEICAVKNSSNQKFLQKEIHNEVFVHFDKKNVTDVKPIDINEFSSKLKTRIVQMENLFNLYQFLIDKELNRNNHIEAMAFYQSFTLNPLLEVIRIRYAPFRYNFRTRYVYYDLPEDIVNRLHSFYFIKNSDELKIKHEEAKIWFNEMIEELNNIKIEELLS